MTDYAKWDKFADDISDDDAPKTQLKLPKARAHSARAFPGRLIACVENVENAAVNSAETDLIRNEELQRGIRVDSTIDF